MPMPGILASGQALVPHAMPMPIGTKVPGIIMGIGTNARHYCGHGHKYLALLWAWHNVPGKRCQKDAKKVPGTSAGKSARHN